MSIILPSSGTFLVRCYSRRRILAGLCTKTGFQLNDENTPLNVELRPCIESHFKCTIMNVKLIFRLGFGVKSQNLLGRILHERWCDFHFKRWKKTTIFEFSWMYRITWLERYIKGSISSKGSLSGTILVRNMKFSSRPRRCTWHRIWTWLTKFVMKSHEKYACRRYVPLKLCIWDN